MINYANQVGESHAIVWRYRDELQDVWPTPPPDDALRFAFTEAAEAMDASLRVNNGYARNNDKTLSVEDELADCAMMLLTAVGDHDWPYMPWRDDMALSLDSICGNVGMALIAEEEEDRADCIAWAVYSIGAYLGWDNFTARITARLERIKAKRSINREG